MLFFKSILVNGGNKYYNTWVLIFTLAALFAALDSCLVLFGPVKTAFTGLGMNADWSTGLTVVLILVYLIVIDYALSVFYPNSINEIITNVKLGANGMQWAIALLTFLFCIGQIATTVGVSMYLRHTSASLAIASPTLVSVDSLVASRTKTDLKAVNALDASIESTQSRRATAIANSQKNRELQKFADNGNGWAHQTLAAKAKDAGASFDKEIKAMVNSKAALLSQNAKNVATVAESAKDDNTFLKNQYTERTNSIAAFLMWFSIIATAFQCFAGLQIALYRSNNNYGNYQRMVDASAPSVSAAVSTNQPSVSTNQAVSTNGENVPKSVSTSEKSVSTAKSVENEPKTDASVSTSEVVKDINPIETVRIALKAKIQAVNQECSNYRKSDGSMNGEAESIADRLADKMVEMSKFLNANPEASTPDIVVLYNKARERGKTTLREENDRKARAAEKQPTLFNNK